MKFENHENYNCEIVTESGKSYRVYANWLHNESLDHWQGWECSAGSSRLYVDKNLQVWGGECRNDSLGHALTDFQILNSTICKKNVCGGCTDDLVISKKRIKNVR